MTVLAAKIISLVWLRYPSAVIWGKKALVIYGKADMDLNDSTNLCIKIEALLVVLDG